MSERLCKFVLQDNKIAVLSIGGSAVATTRQLLESVRQQIFTIADNSEIKGVIIAVQGDTFCRCSSIGPNIVPYEAAALAAFGQQVSFALEKIGKPCVTAASGDCTGIGLELALASDFIIAGHTARFGFPGIVNGQIPFCGGTQRLARLIGKSRAKLMIFSGELIDGQEANRIGLINRLYEDSELMAQANGLLEKICTRSPLAIRVGGEIINAGYDIDLQAACLMERDAFALIFSGHDQREGMQAFLGKRLPEFKGE